MIVQLFGCFERVTTHSTFLMSYSHMLAETSWRIKAEFTRDAFEMLCCRHTRRQCANGITFFDYYPLFTTGGLVEASVLW
jgi:hypothetical protein